MRSFKICIKIWLFFEISLYYFFLMIIKKTVIEKKGTFVKSGSLNKKGYFGMYQPCICELYQDSTTLYLYIKNSNDAPNYDIEFQITRKTNIDFMSQSKQPIFTLTNPHEINEVFRAFDFLKLFPKKGELILSGKDADTISSWVLTIRMRLFCKPSYRENGDNKQNQQNKKVDEDSFEFLSVLGRGYFGKVTLVKQKDTDKLFAMKTIKKNQIFKQKKINNVLTERNILIQVDHPFIVNFYYAFQTNEKFYFIMEYIPGGELFTHIRNHLFNLKDTILYLAEIALAIDYLHSIGIIYRDLKPENILFSAEGHIKLTDFGLSKQISLHDLSQQTTSTFCGTFEYMAPEMITINNPEMADQEDSDSDSSLTSYGFEIDWWSFGILAYEMLYGKTPFYNSNQMKMLRSIVESEVSFPSKATDIQIDFISKFLEKDPSVRANFQNMREHPFWDNIDFNDVLEGNVQCSCNPSLISKNLANSFNCESVVESIGSSTSFRKRMIPGFSYMYDEAAQENIISVEF